MLGRTLRELAAPNFRLFTAYRRENLRPDLVAGISVAAVQIPTAIAYAQLAGFPPLIGLYASILPSVVYALFGSSRQLMVGPDAATCAMVAATLVPLAGADAARYLQLSMALAVLVGVVCILAGLCRAGFIANFLSRPILNGFLNGMGLTIFAGQLGKILGFKMEASDFFPRLAETAAKLGQIHWPTAIFSFALLMLFFVLKRTMPLVPVPLAGIALGIGAVLAFNLGALGVALLGPMPGGSLRFALPTTLSWDDWKTLVPSSAGVAVLTFCSAMAASRSFAAKNGYTINANRDFIALGLANISSSFTRGFCISGADSRTAINDSVKGRTQIVGIVSALATAAVLLFFTAPLANVPNCALGAVLIFAGVGLIDIPGTLRLRHCHVLEFGLSIVATLGVILLGVLPGLAIAIALALFILLQFSSHPREAILGLVPGLDGYNDIAGHPEARTVPGTLIYRFEAPLVFYNVENFTTRVRALVSAAPEPLRFFLYDAEASWGIDSTAADELRLLIAELRERDIRFGIARSKGLFHTMLERTGLLGEIRADNVFVSIRSAIAAWHPNFR
jgi:high affinity sulfate transporter 1